MHVCIANREEISFSETPGISYNIYFVGCSIRCTDCHNPELWDPKAGEDIEIDAIIEKIKRNIGLIDNVCILGGEPTDQLPGLIALLEALQPLPIGIWVYTGRELYEPQVRTIYEMCDFIKCGKYDNERNDNNECKDSKERNDNKENIVELVLASGNQYFAYGGRIDAD